jgi:hypothetical protein
MPDLRIARLFDAPRELVYDAWTDPGQLTRRLGPKGFTGSAATARHRQTPGPAAFPITEDRDDHHTGWTECFERLAGRLHGKEER